MRVAYFDCFAGISGDMTIGALLDLGLSLEHLQAELAKLGLPGYRLEAGPVLKNDLRAMSFKVFLQAAGGESLADQEFGETAGAPAPDHVHDQPHGHNHQHDHPHHPDDHDHPDHAHSHPHEHEATHPPGDHDHRGEPSAVAQSTARPDHPHAHGRAFAEIRDLIQASSLSPWVKQTALAIFTRLAEAEGRAHGVALEQVHFHEVGGVDAIVDIVGAAIGLEALGVEAVYASPLHLGSGFVRAAHGLLPVPAPATANLLSGVPAYSTEVTGELVTPTGAAIITSLAQQYGPMPPMTVHKVGLGAGSRERVFPNVLRIFLGEIVENSPQPSETLAPAPRDPYPAQHSHPTGPGGYHQSETIIIEASIDDMNPQLCEYLGSRLLAAGALDLLWIPVQMKKNRPGLLLQVAAAPEMVDTLLGMIFAESTSIGVRTYPVTKRMLRRESVAVNTRFGPVQVKRAWLGERLVNVTPEYEDCRRLAAQTGAPLKVILSLAQAAGYSSADQPSESIESSQEA